MIVKNWICPATKIEVSNDYCDGNCLDCPWYLHKPKEPYISELDWFPDRIEKEIESIKV